MYILKRFYKQPLSTKLAIVTLLILVMGAVAADLYPADPYKTNIANSLQSPSWSHPFGTDDLGRDYFARILHGGRATLTVGLLSMAISTLVGTTVGVISGYFGGTLDAILMRLVDLLMSIPSFFLILIANAYLKPGMQNIILIIGLFSWMGISRMVRSVTISIKEREYIQYAKMIGNSSKNIMLIHVLRNVAGTVWVAASIQVANAILMESALGYLGLGATQPTASWGSMLKKAQEYLGSHFYLAVFPGMLIVITVLCFNVIGNRMKEGEAQ